MKKVCLVCGFNENPEDSHYCGNCGNNLEDENHEWKIYDSRKSFILPNDYYFGIVSILTGIGFLVLPIIEWSNPEILTGIPTYTHSTLAKIIWIIVSVFLTIIGLFTALYGFNQCYPSKDDK